MKQISGTRVERWIIHKAQHSSGLSIFSTTTEFPLFAHLYEFDDEPNDEEDEEVDETGPSNAAKPSSGGDVRASVGGGSKTSRQGSVGGDSDVSQAATIALVNNDELKNTTDWSETLPTTEAVSTAAGGTDGDGDDGLAQVGV